MALRNIRKDGDPLLRKRSKEIETIDTRLKILLDDMLETMYDAEGVGLAAPQVGILKRAVVVDIGDGPMKLINPVIKNSSGESFMAEGCLSIPDYSGVVCRPEKLSLEYLDIDGNKKYLKAEGFLARAICHEVDHLEGILFKDKVIPEEQLPKEYLEQERKREKRA